MDYNEVLPFRKSLLKALVKQKQREEKALNKESLYRALPVVDQSNNHSFVVLERQEF